LVHPEQSALSSTSGRGLLKRVGIIDSFIPKTPGNRFLGFDLLIKLGNPDNAGIANLHFLLVVKIGLRRQDGNRVCFLDRRGDPGSR